MLSVKEQIFELEGIPVDQQRLLFAGRQLEDDRLLKDYHIQDTGVLNLMHRAGSAMCVERARLPRG